MIIKCKYGRATPNCHKASEKYCDKFNSHCEIEIEISTPALIEELGKRRPDCQKCTQAVRWLNEARRCDKCIWREDAIRTDNFKEANHGNV